MEDGHRSLRWTATRYGVARIRFLDSSDIRASVWVFPTKSNGKIATGWAELASSVTTQKNAQYATISISYLRAVLIRVITVIVNLRVTFRANCYYI